MQGRKKHEINILPESGGIVRSYEFFLCVKYSEFFGTEEKMNFTKEQRKYIRRRLGELRGKKRRTSYLKFGLMGCLLLFGCSTFHFMDTDTSSVLITEAKFIEAKLAILTSSETFKLNAFFKKENFIAEIPSKYLDSKLSFLFGCTPEKKPETPEMIEPKPKPSPPQVIVKAKPKLKIAKAIIYSVKRDGSAWVVKLNKSAIKNKNTRVRIFIGYCYYESTPGEIGKDGTIKINIDWHPPNQTKVGVSVFQLTNSPEIGSGNTLCSVVVPMP